MEVLAFFGAAFSYILLSLFIGGIVGAGIFALSSIRKRAKGRWALSIGATVLVFLLVFGGIAYGQAYTTVEKGTVGLVQRFGGLTGDVFDPGLHWRTPFIDQIVVISTVKQSYETSQHPELSGADWTDVPVTAQTVDGQQIDIRYTVLFYVTPEEAVDVTQNIGPMSEVVKNVVTARSRSWARLLAQNYRAEDLYSGEGIFAYEAAVQEALQVDFEADGVTLDDFLVRKVDFDEEYINAIEQQQIAQEAIETARYNAEAAEYKKQEQIRQAEAEAERTKLLAQADAERTKVLAEAEAEQQRLLADAEAYSIRSRGEVLRQYPEIVQWEFVRNLEGVDWGILPTDGVTPFIPLPSFDEESEAPLVPESP